MKDQNSKKCQQIELNFMFKTDKHKIILFLCHMTKCPMEAEKIKYTKMS